MSFHSFHPGDGLLPNELWQAACPVPTVIHVRGSFDSLSLLERISADGLAIVGTRTPLPRNLDLVRRSVLALRGTSRIIVSGLARGVDAAAHEAALMAGLPTVAFLACGIGQIYPRSHDALAARILKAGGLILSEYDPGEQAYPSRFLERNRLIAAWSRATWMVEAAERSGALNTAAHAIHGGKDLYVTPTFPGDFALAGNQRLLDEGSAHAFWGVHSLGATWLEHSELGCRGGMPSPPAVTKGDPASADARAVTEAVARACHRGGGTTRSELQDELMALDWSPARFHLAVDCACRSQTLVEELGVLFLPAART